MKNTRIGIVVLMVVFALTATELLAKDEISRIGASAKNISTVLSATRLGAIQNRQLGALTALCDVNGKMYGAADGRVVQIGENGEILRAFSTRIKTPSISKYGTDALVIGDPNNKLIYRMDVNSGRLTRLVSLGEIGDDAQTSVPSASLMRDMPLTAVAFDGKNVYAAFSAGFSSPIFKIDLSTQKIVGRGFAAGPNPTSMTFHNKKLLVMDQQTRQIRNYSYLFESLKASRTWIEVGVSDAKGIAVINDEIRVLTPNTTEIWRIKTDMLKLTRPEVSLRAINPSLMERLWETMIPAQKYAVLICGDIAENFGGECFWNDTVWMYKVLLNAGYARENIYVLYGGGSDYASANPAYQHPSVVTDFPATIGWVNRVFDGLKNGDAAAGVAQMRSKDTLFVWTFDHGGGGAAAYLCLWDGNMADTDFAAKLNLAPYAKRAIFMQQCRSGGFIDNLENAKTYISTACTPTQNAYPVDTEYETYGGKIYNHGEYNYYVISALAGLSADSNGNGKISATEAHNWDVTHESSTETPQQSDLGGVGGGFHIKD